MTPSVQIVVAVLGWLTVVGVARSISETRKARWRAMECQRHRHEIDPEIAARPVVKATKEDVR